MKVRILQSTLDRSDFVGSLVRAFAGGIFGHDETTTFTGRLAVSMFFDSNEVTNPSGKKSLCIYASGTALESVVLSANETKTISNFEIALVIAQME